MISPWRRRKRRPQVVVSGLIADEVCGNIFSRCNKWGRPIRTVLAKERYL